MASWRSEAGGFTCCVLGCYNNSKKHKGKFSFYNFPGDQNLRKQWLHNISRKDFRPTTGDVWAVLTSKGASKPTKTRCQLISSTKVSPVSGKSIYLSRLLVRHKEEEIQEETEENEPMSPEENQIDTNNHCHNEPSLEDKIIELRQQIAALEWRNSKL